ncbi:MAG: pyridoxamine 5'-phosphate oxidase family protein [Flaviflexus sp.]|nr:pyridoxamine 5'-phosphate oxidase family protein [Flaviflexus sp.]
MSEEMISKVRDILESTPLHIITSLMSSGSLTSQPMTHQATEADPVGALHYIVAKQSTLVDNIESGNRQLNIAVRSSEGFLSLSGTASLSYNTAELKEWWTDGIDSWFDGGPESGVAALLTVTPESAQYWTSETKLEAVVDVVKAKVTGKRPQGGSSESLNL